MGRARGTLIGSARVAELGSGGRDSEAGDDEKGGAVRLRDNGSSETRVSSLSSGGRDDEKGCAVRLRCDVFAGLVFGHSARGDVMTNRAAARYGGERMRRMQTAASTTLLASNARRM